MQDTGDDEQPSGVLEWIKWLWTTEETPIVYVRDIGHSVAVVVVIGLLLFGVSGIWPPLVAVESQSMDPHIQIGDFVFIMDEHRFAGDEAVVYNGESTGVVPYQIGKETGYKTFGEYGDVIIYRPNGNGSKTPIIHRARLWVNKGENWYDEADQSFVGNADNCIELEYCPAPHAGFITKGDNKVTNGIYDQVAGISGPVKPSWIIGTAEIRIPWLGYLKLAVSAIGGYGVASTALIGGVILLEQD